MTNPLARHFRQPAIYIKLPSAGHSYPAGAIEIPVNEELPVYPMTAIDEITYRTPDALFNGSAIVEVIKSCVPAIADPWAVPAIDIDSILIGIRIASYGHEMEFTSTCPNCATENEFILDLRTILDQLKAPDYSKSIRVGATEIFFKPLSYQQINVNNQKQFEEQRVIQTVPDSTLSDNEKLEKLQHALHELTKLTLAAVAESIDRVVVDETVVTDSAHITEFIRKIDRVKYHTIREHVMGFRKATETKPLHITCQNPECNHEYDTPFTLDVANFFG